MTGRMKFSKRLTAFLLAIVLLTTPIMQVPVFAASSGTSTSSVMGGIGTGFSVFNGVTTFAGKIYNAVNAVKEASDSEDVKAFFMGLMGTNSKEDQVQNGIQASVDQVNSKIDSIAESMDDLSTQLDTVIVQLNTLLSNLDSGVADIKVNLYQSQLQMQEWTTTYTQINNFYTKYSDVRTTLQTTIKTLEGRAADYDAFLETVSSQSNGDEINAALAKLDIACSNYDSLTDGEKELLNTTIEFNASSYTVYDYIKDYSEYTLNLLEDTYDGFASGYSTDMYMTLQNMADFILGQKWQNGGNGGIGEVYYKLAVMSCSNSEEAHEEYKKFVAGVQYDFLLTAYVCALSLKSQIAYNEQMNVNINETATYREYLNSIDELIERVLIYSDYEYKYCVQKYDFDGFVPDGNLTYDDFIVYYANPTNYVNMGISKTYFASRKAASLDGNAYVSNSTPCIAVGEYDKIRVWFNGKEIQSDYELISGDKCVLIEDDGTIIGVHPGSANIYMEVDGNRYPIAVVSVSSSFAAYTGSDTDRYIWFEDGVEKSITHAGQGYDYEYCANLFITSDTTAMDSGANLVHTITDYVQFDGTTIGDYDIVLNHKYGKKNSADSSVLQFSHQYIGSVSLVRTVDGRKHVTVLPIKNSAAVTFDNDVVYGTEENYDTFYIYTKEDLIEWANTYGTGDLTMLKTNVKLMADIDFEWGEWKGVENALLAYDHYTNGVDWSLGNFVVYHYTFDGNGHTIKNINFVPTPTELYSYTNSATGARETKKVVTWGFFSKMSGTLKNLTIENVKYSYYPTEYYQFANGWTYGSETLGKKCPIVMSVFASLANSEVHNSAHNYEWVCEINNCVASGISEKVETDYPIYYDPFGMLMDNLDGKTEQEMAIKNCVYDMDYSFLASGNSMWESTLISGWSDTTERIFTIFNNCESNIFSGSVDIYVYPYLNHTYSLVRTEKMTEPEIAKAKKNIRVLPCGTVSEYTLSAAEANDPEFWTSRGWSEQGVKRYMAGSNYPTNHGGFSVDISNLKHYYHIGEAFDKENLIVYNENGDRITNYKISSIDTATAGEKTVIVSYEDDYATFTVEYVGFVDVRFEYEDTVHIESVATGTQFALPEALFTRDDGYWQTGWYLKDDQTGDPLSFGSKVTVTAPVTYVPSWEMGEMCTVVFKSSGVGADIIYNVPAGTKIIVPSLEGMYNPDALQYPAWANKDNYYFDHLQQGNEYTVTENKTYVVWGPVATHYVPINVYFQNLNDDEYTFMGTYKSPLRYNYHIKEGFSGACNALLGNWELKDYVVKMEAENCLLDEYGYYRVINGDSSATIWVDRPICSVTWKDAEGNEIKSETLRYGAMPTAPTDEEAGVPAGYTPTWDKEIAAVKGNTVYTLSGFVPKDGIEYTVNHMWQNVENDEYTLHESETMTGKTEDDTAAVAKDYNGFAAQTITQVAIAGDGSTVVNVYYNRNTYTVTWDVEGMTTTEDYRYGATPSYKGETPTKASDGMYDYTFTGWGELAPVTDNVTYTAQFGSALCKYTITWDIDGVTTTETYTYGETPVYKGETPVRESTVQYDYTFRDWGEITEVTGDKTYTANFDSTLVEYTITWDVNGEKLTELYKYGETPTYKGVTPTKVPTAQYSYTFAGWGDITEVTGNKTYTAQFTETVNKYTITWNIDGNQITEEYEYGATPSYKGETPARAADAKYIYSFRGWGTILTVTGDKTYTATFDSTINKYNITWIIDGIQFTESYDYGAMPAYKGYTPTKAATAQYTYTFAGWGEITAVTGNKVYTAIFDSTVNKYTITWVVNGEETTEEYEYGAMPAYNGETPVKESNTQYTYTFDGFGSILSVTGDKTYTAQFTETVNKYTITWVVDGVETTEEYEYGATPSYKGETPSKASDGQTAYTFAGWGEITTVTGDKTYTAIFHTETIKYTITWVIGDTQITEKYEYGQTPSYKGETPAKQNTAQYTYTFDGWGDIVAVTGNKTYTAKFSATVNKYTITWNIEGTLNEEEYEYGKTPSYKGATPTKDATAQYSYTFKDWGNITEVTGDATYTATFDCTLNKYSITWVINGEQFTEEYEYGATPVYKGYKPTKPATEQYTYTFAGWGEITKVTGDKIYTAVYNAEYIVPDKITSDAYNVSDDSVSKITAGTTASEFLSALNEQEYCKVFSKGSAVSADTKVGTGMTVSVVDGDKTNATYTIVVTGDVNGDGNITISDMLAVKSHILGKTELTGVYATAADTNGDGTISITDFLQQKAQILGKGDIEAR